MKIQHNLWAMNANRNIKINTGKSAKTTEKLSSGYRINRAADDAAGLSISEKMRRLIRGLTQASRNCQDGISMVQTAEGALNEVHDMLQRMNELAVQSANGTNAEADREALQQEFAQIQDEIDRVSQTTQFNEMRLFADEDSGTGTNGGNTPSVTSLDGADSEAPVMRMMSLRSVAAVAETSVTVGDFTLTGTGLVEGTDYSYSNNTLTILSDKAITISGTTTTDKIVIGDGNTAINANVTLSGVTIDVSNSKFTTAFMVNNGSTLNLTLADGTTNTLKSGMNCAGLWVDEGETLIIGGSGTLNASGGLWSAGIGSNSDVDGGNITINSGRINAQGGSSGGAGIGGGNSSNGGNITINGGTIIAKGGNDGTGIGGGMSSDGGNITITGGTVIAQGGEYGSGIGGGRNSTAGNISITGGTIEATGGTKAAGIGCGWGKNDGNIAISGGTVTAKGGTGGAGIGGAADGTGGMSISVSGGTVEAIGGNGATAIGAGFGGAGGTFTTAGSGNGAELTATTKDNSGNIIQNPLIEQLISDTSDIDSWNIKLNGVVIENQPTIGGAAGTAKNSWWIQAGAEAGQGINIEIGAMNTKVLGIDKGTANILTQESSGNAITAVSGAIEKLSEQRSRLGAYQNRLEHTIRNLDNVVENTTYAESRIRDSDMAELMVEHANNNIIMQAAQAMLAQANHQPDGVLQLLQ